MILALKDHREQQALKVPLDLLDPLVHPVQLELQGLKDSKEAVDNLANKDREVILDRLVLLEL